MKIVTLDEEVKRDNKIVTDWLLFYDEHKKEYLRRRECSVSDSSASYISSISYNSLYDLMEVERWLNLIEEIEQRLPWKMHIFLRLRREYRHVTGRKGWTTAVQWRYTYEVAERLGKNPEDTWVESRFILNRWWDKILDYTVRLAAKRGLL
ncbi:MAG: hypothetical protein A4E56_00387 [Pelotomaculum sp. PtaU1.Bin065]|nr:MAG: hypothetical protein A4E56_00387 [Pelotomaculum sp. PtaU1.Bin065]